MVGVLVVLLVSGGCQSISKSGLGASGDGEGTNVIRIDAGADASRGDVAGGRPEVAMDLGAAGDVAGARDVSVSEVATPDVPGSSMDAPLALPAGEACTNADQCGSGFCVDGVCCAGACTGSCEACNLPDREGECAPVTGNPRGNRPACTGNGTACAGSCDGERTSCSYPGGDRECAAGRCVNGVATTRGVCNGNGACTPGYDVSCAPFSCSGTICAGGCSAMQPCTAGNYCDGGRCLPLKDNGATCQMGAWCKGGNCVDGRCCGVATCGACEACTGAGGTCAKIMSMDDAGSCSGERTCSAAGTCLKKNGQTCAARPECASGNCNDGRCCTVANCGPCSTCTGAGGTCTSPNGTRWVKLPGLAVDIDVSPAGAAWALGIDRMEPGGFGIYRWTGTAWMNVPGAGARISVGPDGVPWLTTATLAIYRRNGDTWQLMPGLAHDIDVGGDGTPWVIGNSPAPGGRALYRWDGTAWQQVDGGGVRISVGPNGNPWVVTDTGAIRRREGNTWITMPGTAREIDVSASGVPWIVGTNPVAGGHGVFRWTGTAWSPVPGGAAQIGASTCMPWIISGTTEISRRE
ncbi:MAG TPA: tectonin domain-containing protein [Polyangia bacterium]